MKKESTSVPDQRKRMESSIKEHTERFRTFSENEHALADIILDDAEDAIAREEVIAPEQASEYRDDLSKIRDELLQLQALSDHLPELKAERDAFADTVQKNNETLRRISNVLKYLSGQKPRRERATTSVPAEDEEKITTLRKTISKEQPANDHEAPVSGERLKEKEEVGTEYEIPEGPDSVEGEITFVLPPPPEKLTREYQAAQKKLANRLHVSLEEARQTVPHGDRIWSFVYDAEDMDIGTAKRFIKYADKVWDLAQERIQELGDENAERLNHREAATQYVYALAAYNRAVRQLNEGEIAKTISVLGKMNRSLGLSGNALVQAMMERYNVTRLKNPFEK